MAVLNAEKRRQAWRAAAAAAKREGGQRSDETTCVICVGPVVSPVHLPCGHAYCGACLAELRAKEVSQTCPLCRAELPSGVDGLYGKFGYRHVKPWMEKMNFGRSVLYES